MFKKLIKKMGYEIHKTYKEDVQDKYKGYTPASNGISMYPFAEWIKNNSTIDVEIIFEIGANFGQDAEYLAQYFGVKDEKVFLFEAHPELCEVMRKLHNYNVFHNAVYNENKEMTFYITPLDIPNTGMSSLFNRADIMDKKAITVDSIRMDQFMEEHNIPYIDFLKLDVEGCNHEVLEGFGDRLKDIKAIHLEAEHVPLWHENNKLFKDSEQLLKNYDFEMIYFSRARRQSDSFWIQKKYIG